MEPEQNMHANSIQLPAALCVIHHSRLCCISKAEQPSLLVRPYLRLCDAMAGLLEIIRKHTYVGMADETHALLQHGTRLYLLDVAELSRDMFYQQVSL